MTCFLTSNSKGVSSWPLVLLTALALLTGCDDSRVCTDNIVTAVVVYVLSPDGRPVDSVTATNSRETVCRDGYGSLTSAVVKYDCWEQGAGSYEVRVTSGDQTWTKEVTVASDGCHVQRGSELFFELTDESADCALPVNRNGDCGG